MLRISTALAALAALSLTPVPAFAQDEEAEMQTTDMQDGEEQVTEVQPSVAAFTPINYDASEDLDNLLLLDLSNGERVAIRLMPQWAPTHVERVKTLTRQGFYDGVVFHRVIDGFMAQTGDPTGTGQGGSELPDMEAEFNAQPHLRGTVSMARAADENSANSQFFIVFYPRFALDKRYTVFGRVIENMAGVDTIQRGEPPANPTRILQASLASENSPPPAPEPAPQSVTEITADELNAPIGS